MIKELNDKMNQFKRIGVSDEAATELTKASEEIDEAIRQLYDFYNKLNNTASSDNSLELIDYEINLIRGIHRKMAKFSNVMSDYDCKDVEYLSDIVDEHISFLDNYEERLFELLAIKKEIE